MANTWNNLNITNLQYTNSTPTIVNSIVAGSNMSVNNSDPKNPILSKSFEGISVYFPTDTSITGGSAIAPWSVTSYSQFYTNSNFNLSTGAYTVPSTGYYLITTSLRLPNTDLYIKNGSTIIGQQRRPNTNVSPCQVAPYFNIFYLTANDVITLSPAATQTVTAFINSLPYSVLSITKIH